MTDTEAPAAPLDPAETAKALAAAREALAKAKADLTDIEARRGEAERTKETERKAREKLAFAATVQNNPSAKAAMKKHKEAERAATEEATNLGLAVADAEGRVEAATEAARIADFAHMLAAGHLVIGELHTLADQFDAAADILATVIVKREAALSRLRETGLMDGAQLESARATPERLLAWLAAATAFDALEEFTSIQRWRRRLPRTAMREAEEALYASIFRDRASRAHQHRATASTSPMPAPGERPAAVTHFDPVTGSRVTRNVETEEERKALAESTAHLQAPPSPARQPRSGR